MTTLSKALVAAGMSLTAVAGVTVAEVGPLAGPAGARTIATLNPIGPNQSFIGLVNGASANATIAVQCPGPMKSNQTGNPVTGQTMAVENPSPTSAAAVGSTGAHGHEVLAEFVPTATVGAEIRETFSDYGSLPIPASVQLPCNGTSTVLFAPRPFSKTAHSFRVSVTFVATCGSTVCPSSGPRDRIGR
jgi:hypothetical protein